MNDLLAGLVRAVTDALGAFEAASRALSPLSLPVLRERLLSHAEAVEASRDRLMKSGLRDDDGAQGRLLEAARLVLEAVERFGGGEDMAQAFMSVLRSLRTCCRAQELLFPLRHELPEIDLFFLEPGAETQGKGHDAGEVRQVPGQDPYERGGYSLFVPEAAPSGRSWPLVVALHGGYGHGRDFLWTWLREARSRVFLLMAPTSRGQTWSLADIGADARILRDHLEEVSSRYAVDTDRILLTGMSDGGTFALGCGLGPDSPTAAMAPVSCVLPPVDLAHARGRRILWVHGAQDWMFPVGRAARACEDLSKAGADVRLRIIPDLSHAYPREENDAILRWFAGQARD